MMGRGAEGGGCCCQGNSCMVEKLMNDGESSDKNILGCQKQMKGMRGMPMDGFNQALKALAVKLPFETEDGSGSGSVPAAFSVFMANNSKGGDHKRKYKKLHKKRRDGGDGNNSARSNQSKGFNSSKIWCEMEEYFREVTAEDIEILLPKTQIQTSENLDVHDSCLLIPPVGVNYRQLWSERDGVDSDHSRADAEQAIADLVLPRQKSISGLKQKFLSTSLHKKGNKITHSTGEVLTIISPSKNGDDKLCHVCNNRDIEEGNWILSCDVCRVMVHQRCYGVQQMPEARWLCSWCSYKFYSSVVSSNKAASDSGNYECHRPSDGEGNNAKVCILCPRTTGALKPVMKMTEDSKKPGNLQFSHVFCCHWMPETYIEDIEMMEPIKNVEGVAKEKWTLLCCLCKENHGACIKCSHGTCDTAFHPLCAKEANLQMEISGKEGSEAVELSAFCPKHSLPHTIRALSAKNMPVAITPEETGQGLFKSRVLFQSGDSWVEHEQQLAEANNGDQSKGGNMFSMGKKDWQVSGQRVCPENCTGAEDSHLKSRDQSSFSGKNSVDTLLGSTVQVEMGDILEEVDSVGFSVVGQRNNLDATNDGVLQMPESKERSVAVEVGSVGSIIEKLRKAIQQMQATLADVAVEMGVSADVLTTLIQGDKCAVSSDLQRRISLWLNSRYLPSNVVCQSESTYKHENSLGVEISNLDSSKERFIHAQWVNGKLESLRSLKKEPPSSREYKSVDAISYQCKESDDNDVAMDDSFTQHILSHDIELDMPVKLSSVKNRIKMMAQSVELDRQNENPTADSLKLRALQGENISNFFLKDLEIDSLNSVVDEMVSLNLSLDLGAKHFDEERRKRGLSKDASTSHLCRAIELCDVGASRNSQTSKLKEWRQSEEFTPKQNTQSTSDTTLNKDSPVGIEKDSQFGHTSSKAESMEVSDCKELCQRGNHVERASIHYNKSLQEFSIDATPVINVRLNVDGHHVESYDRNFISMETLNVQTDVECNKAENYFQERQNAHHEVGRF